MRPRLPPGAARQRDACGKTARIRHACRQTKNRSRRLFHATRPPIGRSTRGTRIGSRRADRPDLRASVDEHQEAAGRAERRIPAPRWTHLLCATEVTLGDGLSGMREKTHRRPVPTRGTGCAGHRPAGDGSRLAGGAGGLDDDLSDDAGVGDQGQVSGVDLGDVGLGALGHGFQQSGRDDLVGGSDHRP